MEEILSLWSKKKILNEHGSTCKQSRHVGKLYMHFNIFYQKNVTHILQQLLIKEIPRHYSLIYPECHQLIIRYDHGNITLRKLFKTHQFNVLVRVNTMCITSNVFFSF